MTTREEKECVVFLPFYVIFLGFQGKRWCHAKERKRQGCRHFNQTTTTTVERLNRRVTAAHFFASQARYNMFNGLHRRYIQEKNIFGFSFWYFDFPTWWLWLLQDCTSSSRSWIIDQAVVSFRIFTLALFFLFFLSRVHSRCGRW